MQTKMSMIRLTCAYMYIQECVSARVCGGRGGGRGVRSCE